MHSVGVGGASSSLLGPFGLHATSKLLERQISIRFPGQDEVYNTFCETTAGTGSGISDLRLRRQNTQTELNENHEHYDLLAPSFIHLNGCEVGDFNYAPHGTSSSEYYQRHRERHLN